jgi:hypothetical protein
MKTVSIRESTEKKLAQSRKGAKALCAQILGRKIWKLAKIAFFRGALDLHGSY